MPEPGHTLDDALTVAHLTRRPWHEERLRLDSHRACDGSAATAALTET